MNDGNDRSVELPKPRITRSRWPLLVWLVPLLAAGGLAFYVHQIYGQRGVEIAVSFSDVAGVKVRDTPLTFHGVRVGSVSRIGLSADRDRAVVYVRLDRAFQDAIARDGGRFWLVRPQVDGGMISGLNTVISGPYIDCIPGGGDPNDTFEGTDTRPVLIGDGLRVVLHTDRLSHLEIDSPVYFRGLQVGSVQDIRFSGDATGVNVTALLYQRYARLLRRGSRFWSVSGTDIHGGVFSGISVEVNNLKALFAGGVAFATPEGDERPVPDGSNFVLHESADKQWLEWSAKIDLDPSNNPGQATPTKTSP